MFKLGAIEVTGKPFRHFVLDGAMDDTFFEKLKDLHDNIFENRERVGGFIETKSEYFLEGSDPGVLISTLSRNSLSQFNEMVNFLESTGSLAQEFKLFYDQVYSKRFWLPIIRKLVPFNFLDLKTYRKFKLHHENTPICLFDFIFYRNCYARVRLSSYSSNTGLIQHKDHPDKLVALLLYFGFSDNKNREVMGTTIYKLKDGSHKWSRSAECTLFNLNNRRSEHLIPYLDVHPNPNRLFGFVRSNHSWHSVEPAFLPADEYRQAIQLNLWKLRKYSRTTMYFLKILNIVKSFLKRR